MFGPPVAGTSNMVFKKCGSPCDFLAPLLGNSGDGPATNGSLIHVNLPAIWLKVMSFSSSKDYYLMIHFDVADSVIGEIQKRFNQENFDLYAKCEELLISAASVRERRKLGNHEKAFW